MIKFDNLESMSEKYPALIISKIFVWDETKKQGKFSYYLLEYRKSLLWTFWTLFRMNIK